jgi:hypothetical protein
VITPSQKVLGGREMTLAPSFAKLLCTVVITFAMAATAHAASGRTFVSGTGNDSNTGTNCARATPCRTLATAYSVTNSGGEIQALDPAGYGTLTITGPVAILGVPGAGLTVPGSGTGITINAGATDQIIINNLDILAGTPQLGHGIDLVSGRLTLQNTTLKQLAVGLNVVNAKANLFHVDTVSNFIGIEAAGAGPTVGVSGSGTTEVLLFFGSAFNNGTAYVMASPGTNTPNILEFLTDSSGAYSTAMAGNGTLVGGNGTGCPCTTLGTFASNTNPN